MTMTQSTDLLLLDLSIPSGPTLTFQCFDPSLESSAEGTCLVNKFFQLLGIA